MTPEALILLADGFEEIEAVTSIDILRRAGVRVVVAGIGSKVVTGSHAIRITADLLLEDYVGTPDAVVLPGGMPGSANLRDSDAVRQVLRRADAAGKIIAAICAAPAVVLAATGLVSDKTVTCYPGFEKQLGPDTRFSTDSVVQDGRLITSRGPGTAMEFALRLARALAGDESARRVAEAVLHRT